MVKSIPVSSASSEDFMELRAVDAWLNMMVDLEELEQDHLISLALRYSRNVVGMSISTTSLCEALADQSMQDALLDFIF